MLRAECGEEVAGTFKMPGLLADFEGGTHRNAALPMFWKLPNAFLVENLEVGFNKLIIKGLLYENACDWKPTLQTSINLLHKWLKSM